MVTFFSRQAIIFSFSTAHRHHRSSSMVSRTKATFLMATLPPTTLRCFR